MRYSHSIVESCSMEECSTCCSTSGLSQGSTLTPYWGKSWTTLALWPWRIRLKMLRRPDMQTCPSAEINTWLAFTLLRKDRHSCKTEYHSDATLKYRYMKTNLPIKLVDVRLTGGHIPCGGCIQELWACQAECMRWSVHSYHRQIVCK